MNKKPALPLHPGEQILRTYRETELVLLVPALIICAGIYLPWFFLIKYDLYSDYSRLIFFWTFLVTLYGLRTFFLWYLKEYIITSQRLVYISHNGLFKKRVQETPLERMLNISFQMTGVISSIFKFGDVEVQVVGLFEPIVLKNIRLPAEVKDYLWFLHSKFQDHSDLFKPKEIPKIQEKIGYRKPNKTL